MHAKHIAGMATALVAALAIAGCTGNFSVKQTEPFRVQIDGAPQTAVVAANDSQPERVEVETAGHDNVEVKVQAQQVSSGPCKLHVKVQDKETGEVLEERDIDITVNVNSGSTGNGTSNTTVTQTQTETQTVTQTTTASGQGQVVVQNFYITVKGHHNVVVLTQALQGSAQVNVQAVSAQGNGSVGGVTTDSGSASASMTNSTAPASSTSTTY
jgi:hypothetical protein